EEQLSPLEATRKSMDEITSALIGIALVQRLFLTIEAIQIADQILYANVVGVLHQVPVQLLVMIPLAPLAELAPHEQQLLARVRPHE
ncbi:multidrug efflux transporter, partial [Pseudomonas savastanoi pv. glycinea str. race 4]